jgi:regulator of RNase E activity RraA
VIQRLAAAPIADAVVRLGLAVRMAPVAVRRFESGESVIGPAVPCSHSGSVDVFLEALETAEPGGILVVDNEGRTDEACLGDLAALEVQSAGLAGVVIWGCHRDRAELRRIGLPMWSLGSLPFGPRTTRPGPSARLERARVGDAIVTRDDVVIADDDGVLFVEASRFDEVLATAATIADREGAQAAAMRAGRSLRDQLRFADYLVRRTGDPTYDFRRHLADVGGAIET